LCVAPVITIFYNEFSNSHLEYCSILVLFTIKMKSSRSKRRRIIQSYVSPPRPDLPATFESLSDDPLTTIVQFVGRKSYKSVGVVNKRCKEIYLATKGMTKETFVYGYAPLSIIQERFNTTSFSAQIALGKGVVYFNRRDLLDWAVQEQNKDLLSGICEEAGEEGRIDLLDEVWDNVNDEGDKRYVFQDVDYIAALYDKLEVMKWVEDKGIDIDKEYCAKTAVWRGHLDILKWLREERGLELKGGCYDCAIRGSGQLRVMKWLREQACPWGDWTFATAAQKGNLDVLQWLHDEGCPWPEDYRVDDFELEAEALEWCRGNGYSGRIFVGRW